MQALEFGHYLVRVPIARREEYSGAANALRLMELVGPRAVPAQ